MASKMQKLPAHLRRSSTTNAPKEFINLISEMGTRIRAAYADKHSPLFFSADDLKKIGVQVFDLDRYKDPRHQGLGKLKDSEGEQEAWWNAHFMAGEMNQCVGEGRTHREMGIQQFTPWSARLTRPANMFSRGKVWYEVHVIYHYGNEADRSLGSCPHTGGILVQDVQLAEDELTPYEVYSFHNLTCMRIQDGFLSDTTIIPITVISMGGPYARVLHGYFSAKAKGLVIYKSPVLRFDQPGQYATDDWKRLLCWLLAEPVSPRPAAPAK